MLTICPENPARHADAIEALYDLTFGPGHFAKTAERLREGTFSLPWLSRVACHGERVVGVCRIWPIEVGEARNPAVFVGPVAVAPEARGEELGLQLTEASLAAAQDLGWTHAVIIGAPSYFGRIGFEQVPPGTLVFPGPQDQARIMVKALSEAAEPLSGRVEVPLIPRTYIQASAPPDAMPKALQPAE